MFERLAEFHRLGPRPFAGVRVGVGMMPPLSSRLLQDQANLIRGDYGDDCK
jgi:hypothetical protein